MTTKRYRTTSHRLRPPEETLALVTPHLKAHGITRCADLTGLDRLNIPVCSAFNPVNPLLQASWGKGARLADAGISACMEAIERFQVTLFDPRERTATIRQLRGEGRTVLPPRRLQRFNEAIYFSEKMPISWLAMEVLGPQGHASSVYAPAAAVYPRQPQVNFFSANGLAGGNCVEEAQLHALYEIIERHGISSSFDAAGRLTLKHDGTRRMDMARCRVDSVRELNEKILRAGLEMVLLHMDGRVNGVHLFWAVLLEADAPVPWTRANIGYGAHYCPEVAAVRAITEAAQSRMAYLHGCREDMAVKMRHPRQGRVNKVVGYFSSFASEMPWDALEDRSGATLIEDWHHLLAATAAAGFPDIYWLRIPCRIEGIAIVKLVVEGMRLRHGLF
jgi:ribosomal protein S12 methylthiotransferase accessory factor